jgi:N6-adenosine-specific RNA methylase IME4
MGNERMKYRTIVADPPWNECGGGKIKRGADRHYPVMKSKDILHLMQDVLVGHDPGGCHLYLWVTNNFLEDGLFVMKGLGFRYVTMRTWAKDRIGLGYYYRGQTESCLFGVMGKLPSQVRTESTLIGKGIVPRGRHSAKPKVFFEEVERVSPGPYLELFARSPRRGWTVWGNECPPAFPLLTEVHQEDGI